MARDLPLTDLQLRGRGPRRLAGLKDLAQTAGRQLGRVPLNALADHLRHVDGAAPAQLVFRTNHASNYLALKGTLPRDKEALLKIIRAARQDPALLRTESQRGL